MCICTVIAWTIGLYWILISALSIKIVLSAFNKYTHFKRIDNPPQQWTALIRDDFDQWKKGKILLGCILFNPIKFLVLLIFQSTCILVFHIAPTEDKIKRKQFLINNWFRLSRPIFFNFIFRVKEEFDREPITTPIVISNHVSWFDMYYVLLTNKISSFLSKEQVKDYWFLGTSAKGINSVFIKRKNEEDRDLANMQIAERIKDFQQKKQGAYPLIIFPEGTTSNGKGLLSFKSGAFQNLSPITAYSLKYECDSFGLGIDEIGQLQSLILALAQWPKLCVKKIVITAMEGESVKEYMGRTKKLLADAHKFKCTEGGFRDSLKLVQYRKNQNKKSKSQ